MTGLFDTAPAMLSGATISECGLYRYHLWRVWDEHLPCLCFVMQNPSTADATEDDATIRRCIGFAKRDGFGGISVRNVFALRATDERGAEAPALPQERRSGGAVADARDRTRVAATLGAWPDRSHCRRSS